MECRAIVGLDHLVKGILKGSLLNCLTTHPAAGTGAMAQEHSATAAQHLARRRQGSGELASTLQLRSWAEALQGSAGGAAAKLTASARVRAADAGPATLEGVVSALSAAIDAVEQVVGPYGGSLDASTAAVLRQCSTRLEGLLSVAGV